MTTEQLKNWARELNYSKETVEMVIDFAYENGVTDGRLIELREAVKKLKKQKTA